MKILVFGKDGQLGKAFKKLFDTLPSSWNWIVRYVGRDDCDVSNEQALNDLLTQFAPDLIINAAAYTAVDKAEEEVKLAHDINARAPEVMATYAFHHGSTLLHYSTDYVFDGKKERPYLESDERSPLGSYGKSKAAGEAAIEVAFQDKTLGRYAILRTSWVYGDGSNFIRTILRLAKERTELRVIDDQYGVPTNADWLARVSFDLVFDQNMQLRPFSSGIYHAVPSGQTTWYGLAKLAIETAHNLGIALKLQPESIIPILAVEYPLPAPRPQNSRLDNSKLQLLMRQGGDMPKLEHLNISWEGNVRKYVGQLAEAGLI